MRKTPRHRRRLDEDYVVAEDSQVAEDSKFCEVDENEDRAILQARTSVNEWKVELERVGPKRVE